MLLKCTSIALLKSDSLVNILLIPYFSEYFMYWSDLYCPVSESATAPSFSTSRDSSASKAIAVLNILARLPPPGIVGAVGLSFSALKV
jgi:hypothetical protein